MPYQKAYQFQGKCEPKSPKKWVCVVTVIYGLDSGEVPLNLEPLLRESNLAQDICARGVTQEEDMYPTTHVGSALGAYGAADRLFLLCWDMVGRRL